MNLRNLLLITLTSYSVILKSQDSISIYKILEEVQIMGITANPTTPISFTNIKEKELENTNLGQDLPYLISFTPSVISSSDAGAGIGYSYMTIRGSDASRINVTINGIPLNDSESQGVWWVNMPDFTSSVSNIQIQRGVGVSTNGGSAFGATINLQTNTLKEKKYFSSSNSIGSFNTIKNNIEFGSGLINGKWTIDGRLSRIKSEGYIDRASSNLKSIYLEGGYYGQTSSIKGILFSGHERTYQAWYGVPNSYLDSIRTFNPYNYENEVDDYGQTHVQFHINKKINSYIFNNLFLNIGTHYTKGAGYYEQYIGTEHNSIIYEGEYIYGENNLSFYGLEDTIVNLTRRKWLDNDFYGTIFNLKHSDKKTNIILGGGANTYNGAHFGRVVSTELNENLNHEYYRNNATKNDMNIYIKLDYSIFKNLNAYIDLQARYISYVFEGNDVNGDITEQKVNLKFFNPKYGLFYKLSNNSSIYGSFSEGKKEPNRNDYIESSPISRPIPETLFDTELGYKFNSENVFFGINLYNMRYKNQLINTGEINDVGASIRSNIDKSYRRGLELEASLRIIKKLKWAGNLTISENKIVEHTEYIENWDTYQNDIVHYDNNDIAFSPNLIAKSKLSYNISKLETNLITRHVGPQYIDNSQSNERKLKEYTITDLLLSYNVKFKTIKNVKIHLMINNIFNKKYVDRAWVYRFTSDSWNPLGSDPYINQDANGYNMIGNFPQSTTNYLLGLTLEM